MMECSTATANSTDKNSGAYIGRFAPSPTGPLHLGSIYAALGSYLHARAHGGQWLIRIEDLDPPREQAGASEHILQTLKNWGLESDQAVLFQSQRLGAYQDYAQQLLAEAQAYPCSCSRKQVQAMGQTSPEGWRYNGHCRTKPADTSQQYCLRLDSRGHSVRFEDELQGWQEDNPEQLYGDFVIRRADGFFAYQLAVVVDDAFQNISHIVRGIDLMSSTSRQIRLQQKLQLPQPQYCHLPVLTDQTGQKLSKQNHAEAIASEYQGRQMLWLLAALGLSPPASLASAPADSALQWAVEHWQTQKLASRQQITVDF